MSALMQPTAAQKSVLSYLGPLTPDQRAAVQALIGQGIDAKTARAIVLGYAGVRKDFDESQHPRAENGQFGPGAAMGHVSGKAIYANARPEDRIYGDFTEKNHLAAAALYTKAAEDATGDAKETYYEAAGQHRSRANFVYSEDKATGRSGVRLSEDEYKSLSDYVLAGDDKGYRAINAALDSKAGPALAAAEHINVAIQRSPLTKQMNFYRGSEIGPDVKPGATIFTPRLLSTSSDRDVAEQFSRVAALEGKAENKGTNARYAVFKIIAPAGTKVLDVKRGAARNSHSENEHLFGSNQKFIVSTVKRNKSTGMHEVTLRAVPDGDTSRVTKKAGAQMSFTQRVTDDAGFNAQAPQTSASKSVLSQWGPLTGQQRADMQNLIQQGIDENTARAIVLGYAGVHKAADDAPGRPSYAEAYLAHSKATLPAWQHDQLHAQARAIAGGHASALVRQAPDPKTANLQELDLLKHRMDYLQQEVAKQSLLSSEAHVPVPLGSGAGRRKKVPVILSAEDHLISEAYGLVAKDFDETKHPRAANGKFGSDTKTKPLSFEQRQELGNYLNGHDDMIRVTYKNINRALRGETAGMDGQKVAANLKSSAVLNQIINERPLAHDKVLFRGTSLPENLVVGQNYSTPSLLSTTDHEPSALLYAAKNKESPAVLRIEAQAGTPAVSPSEHFKLGANVPREFIFGSHQKFVVTHIEPGDGTRPRYVHLRAQDLIVSKAARQKRAVTLATHDAVSKGFDESKHPRAANGKFGQGASGEHLRASNKHAEAAAHHLSKANDAMLSGDDVAFAHHLKMAQQSHALNRASLAQAAAAATKVKKADTDALAYAQAAYDLQAPAQVDNPDAGRAPDAAAELMQANRLVAGMDAEIAAGAQSPDEARRRASRALQDRPGLYDHIGTSPTTDRLDGLQLDLGSGTARAPGFIGLDLGTFGDYGNALHDINLGLGEFPDGSVKAVRLVNSLHNILDDEGHERDPTPLLNEIQRVMCEGGTLTYVGPEPLFEGDNTWPVPGLLLMGESGVPASEAADAAGAIRQVFERVPPRVPAYHGADANYAPAGPMPIDVALAMAAMNVAPARMAMANLVNKRSSQSEIVHKTANRVVRIAKTDPAKQIVYGVVLDGGGNPDLQGDVLTHGDIEAAAHGYLGTSRVIGSEHSAPIQAHPVESFIAPQELTFDGPGGRSTVPKGSWVLGVKITDPDQWAQARDGGYNSFSVGGFGVREDLQAA